MALTATFAADMTQFESALKNATVTATTFDKAIKNSQRDLKREIATFSGDKIVIEATRMSEAITRMGREGGLSAGLLKLLPTELAKVGAAMDLAAQKATLMGDQVPDSVKRAREEIAKIAPAATAASTGIATMPPAATGASAAITGLGTAFKTLGPLIGITGILGAVTGLVRLGKAAFDSAGEIIDLSHRTGMSTASIQKMQAVADQTSTSLEAFTKSATFLGVNIANGTTKAREAVQDLGLSFTQLAAMKPEEQFHAVIAALEKEEDVGKRNAIGRALFGRQWDEIAAGIAQGYSGIADAARISSDAQLQALDKAGDAWDKFKTDFTAGMRSMMGNAVMALQEIERGADSLSMTQKAGMAISSLWGEGYLVQLRNVGKGLNEADKHQRDYRLSTEQGNKATVDYAAALASARAEVSGLSSVQRDQLNAALKLGGDAAQTYADNIGLSSEALRLFQAPAQKATTTVNETAQAMRSMFGLDVIAKAETYTKTLGGVENITKLTTAKKKELRTAVEAALDVYERLGRQVPQALRDILRVTTDVLTATKSFAGANSGAWVPFVQGTQDAGAALHDLSSRSIPEAAAASAAADAAMLAWAKTNGYVLIPSIQDTRDELTVMTSRVANFTTALKDMPQAIVAAFQGGGDVLKTIGSSLGVALGHDFVANFGQNISKHLPKFLGDAINSIIPGIGALLGPLLGKIGGFFKGLFGGVAPEVKEARIEIDAFQKKLAETLSITQRNEAGNERWKMTIIAVRDAFLKVGRTAAEAEKIVQQLWDTDRPDKARAAMEEINKVLGLVGDEQEALNDAISRYGFTIEELGPTMQAQKLSEMAQQLVKDYDLLTKSGIAVGTVTERMADEINEYLRIALRTGQEVPASMRPMLEQMVEMGLLVDESGEKLTDLKGIKFAETLTQGFDRVATAIGKLPGEIARALGIAASQSDTFIDKIRKGIDSLPDEVHIRVIGEYEAPDVNTAMGGGGGGAAASMMLGGGIGSALASISRGSSVAAVVPPPALTAPPTNLGESPAELAAMLRILPRQIKLAVQEGMVMAR